MTPFMKTIAKDILALSAQAVLFRLSTPQEQQQGVIFAAVPTKGGPSMKAIPGENEPQARKVGF